MNYEIIIPYPCNSVIYPHKSVPVWDKTTQIGKATISTHKGVKTAKSDINATNRFIARGRLILREGDIINEYVIIGFDLEK